jgi:hypothetical protein
MSTQQKAPFRRIPALLLVATAMAIGSAPAQASSHREAPFIATQPQVDATDFYMFRSYEPGRGDYVTIVADYIPVQDPQGGPNFFKLDPNAVYDINIVNDGGASPNITFRFKFQQQLADNQLMVGGKAVSIPLVQNGSADVAVPLSAALNVTETYTVDVIRGGNASAAYNLAAAGNTFYKPADNIGNKTISDYVLYANKHIANIAFMGCGAVGNVFVGQRKDPFVVNLGEIFDLVNIKYPATELNPGAEFATADTLAGKNVTSIIMELPIACLTEGKGDIIGGYTTASVPAERMLTSKPAAGLDGTTQTGSYVQVSRLGMPLVNEIVIGLKDKNKFNGSDPKDDGQFLDYVTNPTLPALLEILFGGAGVNELPAHRPGGGVPDGHRRRQQAGQRRAVGNAAAQHRDRADTQGGAEPAGRAGRRQRRLPQRSPAWR